MPSLSSSFTLIFFSSFADLLSEGGQRKIIPLLLSSYPFRSSLLFYFVGVVCAFATIIVCRSHSLLFAFLSSQDTAAQEGVSNGV